MYIWVNMHTYSIDGVKPVEQNVYYDMIGIYC